MVHRPAINYSDLGKRFINLLSLLKQTFEFVIFEQSFILFIFFEIIIWEVVSILLGMRIYVY